MLSGPGAEPPAADVGGTTAAAQSTIIPSFVNAESTAAIAKELEVMKLRIQQLESQLSDRTASQHAPVADLMSSAPPDAAPNAAPTPKTILEFYSPASRQQNEQGATGAAPAPEGPTEPFAYADWTWLNGNYREKEKPWDSKFFTPEIRFDTSFIYDFNHPKDDTLGGSTEIFRSNEIQMDQISFGGDFHWNNVRGRVLTMNGLFAVTPPRNDASPARGQMVSLGCIPLRIRSMGRLSL